MRIIKKVINPQSILRLSLGFIYLYSGISILRFPDAWMWVINSLPQSLISIIDGVGTLLVLRVSGFIEIILGIAFLLWFLPRGFVRICAFLSAVGMVLSIILVNGVGILDGTDTLIFRDVAIAGSSFALYLLLRKREY